MKLFVLLSIVFSILFYLFTCPRCSSRHYFMCYFTIIYTTFFKVSNPFVPSYRSLFSLILRHINFYSLLYSRSYGLFLYHILQFFIYVFLFPLFPLNYLSSLQLQTSSIATYISRILWILIYFYLHLPFIYMFL